MSQEAVHCDRLGGPSCHKAKQIPSYYCAANKWPSTRLLWITAAMNTRTHICVYGRQKAIISQAGKASLPPPQQSPLSPPVWLNTLKMDVKLAAILIKSYCITTALTPPYLKTRFSSFCLYCLSSAMSPWHWMSCAKESYLYVLYIGFVIIHLHMMRITYVISFNIIKRRFCLKVCPFKLTKECNKHD